MASIDIPFSTYDAFGGAGASPSVPLIAFYPPEFGCFGLGLVGAASDATTHASLTDRAREMIARAVTDGTSIRVTHFAFGAGGYDPVDPLKATLVDPSADSLEQETYRKIVDVYENASVDGRVRSFAARLSRGELVGGIGEYALIATILYSPDFPAEVGSRFVFAIGHQGLRAVTRSHVETYRIIVTV